MGLPAVDRGRGLYRPMEDYVDWFKSSEAYVEAYWDATGGLLRHQNLAQYLVSSPTGDRFAWLSSSEHKVISDLFELRYDGSLAPRSSIGVPRPPLDTKMNHWNFPP